MDTTSISLLERLRQPAHEEAWARFVNLYTPFIYYWARRVGLTSEEAADLVQDVLTVLVQKLPEFQYDPEKSFRGWLRTVTLNKWRENRRRVGVVVSQASDSTLAGVVSPQDEETFWQVQYRHHV